GSWHFLEGDEAAFRKRRLAHMREPVSPKTVKSFQLGHQVVPAAHFLVQDETLRHSADFAANQIGRQFVALEELDPFDLVRQNIEAVYHCPNPASSATRLASRAAASSAAALASHSRCS